MFKKLLQIFIFCFLLPFVDRWLTHGCIMSHFLRSSQCPPFDIFKPANNFYDHTYTGVGIEKHQHKVRNNIRTCAVNPHLVHKNDCPQF